MVNNEANKSKIQYVVFKIVNNEVMYLKGGLQNGDDFTYNINNAWPFDTYEGAMKFKKINNGFIDIIPNKFK